MQSIRFMIFAVILAACQLGCSHDAKMQSEEEISEGNAELSKVDEMEKVQDVTQGDYDKMTKVDPAKKEEAMADFDRAVREDPTNAEAYYARGFANLSHDNAFSKAIGDFSKAIELKPDYARAYLMRGRAYEAIGEQERAKADRAKALELDPTIDQ